MSQVVPLSPFGLAWKILSLSSGTCGIKDQCRKGEEWRVLAGYDDVASAFFHSGSGNSPVPLHKVSCLVTSVQAPTFQSTPSMNGAAIGTPTADGTKANKDSCQQLALRGSYCNVYQTLIIVRSLRAMKVLWASDTAARLTRSRGQGVNHVNSPFSEGSTFRYTLTTPKTVAPFWCALSQGAIQIKPCADDSLVKCDQKGSIPENENTDAKESPRQAVSQMGLECNNDKEEKERHQGVALSSSACFGAPRLSSTHLLGANRSSERSLHKTTALARFHEKKAIGWFSSHLNKAMRTNTCKGTKKLSDSASSNLHVPLAHHRLHKNVPVVLGDFSVAKRLVKMLEARNTLK